MINKTYDNGLYTLPNFYGHAEDTEIHFPEHNIFVTVLNNGKLTFYNEKHNEIAQLTVTPNTENGMHDNIYCKCESGKITFWFPIVTYVDNYPHCDGEYDRWSVKYIAYDCLIFDIASRSFERSEVKAIG